MNTMSNTFKSQLDGVRVASLTFALLLGSLMIWGVTMAPIAIAHNATHDTRHSLGLPCH